MSTTSSPSKAVVTFMPQPSSPKPIPKCSKIQAQHLHRKLQKAELESKGPPFEVVERPSLDQTSRNGGPDEDITEGWHEPAPFEAEAEDEAGVELLALEWERFKMKMNIPSSLSSSSSSTAGKSEAGEEAGGGREMQLWEKGQS